MKPVETPLDRASVVDLFWSSHDESLHLQSTLTAVTDFSDAYFERGRWGGFGPRFLKIGRRVRYRKRDVIDWIESRPAELEERAVVLEKLQAGVQHQAAELSPAESAEKLASKKKLGQARADFAKQPRAKPKAKRRAVSKTRSPQVEV